MTANEESWDLDTDEIRSVDSEELYETRPNRWKGNKATWNTYTQEERLLHRSMEQLRNRDLSVHLYNAFALRNRAVRPSAAGEPNDADIDRPLEEIVDSGEWRPPNLWTAWPMNSRIVPGDDFLKETHDEDDDFTTRSRKEQLPSTALEEEMTATILRQAKERFLRRQRKAREREEAARIRDESANERTAASSMSAHSSAVSDEEDDEDKEGNAPPPSGQGAQAAGVSDVDVERPKRSKTYEPVVSANDDLSADLLRPSVRHILSTLDNTLTALHNSRLAGLSYMTDSSASATDVEDNNNHASDAASVSSAASRASSSASKRKKKGRPRSKAPRTPEPEWTRALERRGRPKKVAIPLPGETEKEMKIRIARASKKRIPFSSDEEDAAAAETEGEDAVVKKDEEGSEGETSRSRSPRKRRDLPAEARAEAKTKARETMLGNWGLRDWSDVIGAASLSGFKPEVVARAAQRCADLFGQGMEMQTLFEGPATKGPKPQTTRYIPGGGRNCHGGGGGTADPYAGASSSEDSEKERPIVKARRLGMASSRQNSLARDSIPPSDSDATGRGRSILAAAAAARRSRSASRASSAGFFYCPVSGCERSLEGFGRRANLQRHVATMHPGRVGDVLGGGGGGSDRFDVGSEDEMMGAVHVDGFLRPIRARKGWRAEDTGKRKRKRHYRGRRRDGSDGGSGVEEAVLDST
ncbi:RNA polymerase I-specific transcription initiation factor-domain-containing protein [Colletotrichum acutatum]|uniref:RNA polymerase I-specific transcription initiation factor-domain-containing protein n=1 Tax=Glomerella acutata TaxID=27357 RepID=A0AAD8XQF9_GLOAC|nr:RNA polymerase I-specific transcription initiation factor-domain-containing protein [Colletotrichum acutatum]KAK1731683.1 RNA polymerase I-specific transcription initiation factor-domain-containing protein [Colletotrichum acutatum]